jgi:hypothetical protein
MSSNQIDWGRIENFIGYGRLDAHFVFIGMEEGADKDNEKLTKELFKRSHWNRVIDLPEYSKTSVQKTWRPICEILLALESICPPPENAESFDRGNYNALKLAYQNNTLGRSNGAVLMTELMPYPKNKHAAWPQVYKDDFPDRKGYPEQQNYEEAMVPKRMKLIGEVIRSHPRKLIVCYGKHHWDRYAQMLGINSINRNERWPTARLQNAVVIFCNHFSAPSFYSDKTRADFVRFATLNLEL